MSYVDGFVFSVAQEDRQKFIDFARDTDAIMIEFGATRVVECWGDDVPDGTLTDFRKSVQATGDEVVVFSWIEWPDKPTRDTAYAKMMDPVNPDPRMDATRNPPPFDGKRMIFGGFDPVVILGE